MTTVIAETIRSEIVGGIIAPDQRINVRDLERRFEVSHIPIREALRLLEAEGLLRNQAGRGAVAAGVSVEELDDVYDLRLIIEGTVIRRAVEAATDQDVAAMQESLHRLEALEQEGEARAGEFFAMHWDFHRTVLAPGLTTKIVDVLGQLWQTADRYVRLAHGIVLDEADEQHRQLVELCREGDADEAVALVERHLLLTRDAVRFHYVPPSGVNADPEAPSDDRSPLSSPR